MESNQRKLESMKYIFVASVVVFLAIQEVYPNDSIPQGTLRLDSMMRYGEYERFVGWTDVQYQQYEDSVCAKLYPPVYAKKSDAQTIQGIQKEINLEDNTVTTLSNSIVPNTVYVSYAQEVGEITVNSGVSQSGAKTYNVPLKAYHGMNGFNPNLSLNYNSQQGNSVLGMGWTLSGVSVVERAGKSIYYDNRTQGVVMDNSDSFFLDGCRLIKISTSSDYILYESEQGNIKIKGYYVGNILKYFEVFFPNGYKGIFGFTSNNINQTYYPITSLQDLMGNQILYSYNINSNHYDISNISYNDVNIKFQYTSRNDPILRYSGGNKIYEEFLLKSISYAKASKVLYTYDLSYSTKNDVSLLTQIDYAGTTGVKYNPLHFYYGEGAVASYSKDSTQLLEWYVSEDPNMIKAIKDKFDYYSNSDGIIVLPNRNPYWKHYRHSTLFRHSQNRFDNKYDDNDEKIFIYAGLKNSYADPMPNLTTEKGFVDILCADIDGKQEEYIIKVNNYVDGGNDHVIFKVYRANLYSGLALMYTRTFDFPTVYTDSDGGKSIQPKFYYSGDFNGDGKAEIMAVSVHQPFGDTTKPSKCYIFDLAGNKILYQGHILDYTVEFLGTALTDEKTAENNTDRLFVIDYDGDGKSDLCHINDGGVNVYTFGVSGAVITPTKISTYTILNKTVLANCLLLPGEYNGDGKTDLLVSPSSESTDRTTWAIYNSKGNGLFEKNTFSGPYYSTLGNTGYLVQDINGDGVTDLLRYDDYGFNTYLMKQNNPKYTCYSQYSVNKSTIIPTCLNTNNVFTQIVSINKGIATKYAFNRDDNKESMATGMANSLGIIEKNEYVYINGSNESLRLFTRGSDAIFPYVNIQEPFAVIAKTETYMNNQMIDHNNYMYENAVVHKQGLGFCGFGKITTFDKRNQASEKTFEPYNFGLLSHEKTPKIDNSYTYHVSVGSNKLVKIRLTSSSMNDLLKGITANITYKYDSYGYPLEEITTFSDGISVTKTNT